MPVSSGDKGQLKKPAWQASKRTHGNIGDGRLLVNLRGDEGDEAAAKGAGEGDWRHTFLEGRAHKQYIIYAG